MIRNTQYKRPQPIIIDLDGEQGNVFWLMSLVKRFSVQYGLKDVTKEMMSHDYEHAILAFEAELGDYVILETKNQTLLADLMERKRFLEQPVKETSSSSLIYNF